MLLKYILVSGHKWNETHAYSGVVSPSFFISYKSRSQSFQII